MTTATLPPFTLDDLQNRLTHLAYHAATGYECIVSDVKHRLDLDSLAHLDSRLPKVVQMLTTASQKDWPRGAALALAATLRYWENPVTITLPHACVLDRIV